MLQQGLEPIPGYRLEKFLGRGQFGDVWECTAPGGTHAALKFIDLGHDGGINEYRSIQRMKEIRHPHLMPIIALWLLDEQLQLLSHDVAEALDDTPTPAADGTMIASQPGVAYVPPRILVIAMLKADMHLGNRQAECAKEGHPGIPVDELLGYMEEAAKGIDFLNESRHDLGEGPIAIQHCDIKPANILLMGGAVMIADFGLARLLSDATATSTQLEGSPAYMSPESVRRKPGRGSDQYSLAISYYHLRSGMLPFSNTDAMSALQANVEGNLNYSAVPFAERAVLEKATSADAANRFDSSSEMVRALRAAVSGQPITLSQKTSRRSYVVPILASVLSLLGIATLAAYFTESWPFDNNQIVVTPRLGPVNPTDTSDEETQADDDNGARDDIVDGGRGHITEQLKLVLQFEPPDAHVTINDRPVKLSEQGETEVDITSGEDLQITASHPSGDYQPLSRTLTSSEFEQPGILTLSFTASHFLQVAFDALAGDDRERANQFFREAVALNPDLAAPTRIELLGHAAPINRIAITSDWLISISDKGEVGFWKLDGQPISTEPIGLVTAHDAPTVALAVSGNERIAITAGWDSKTKIWNLEQAEPHLSKTSPLANHSSDIVDAVLQTEPLRAITASFDKTIVIHDLTEAATQPVAVLKEHDVELESVTIAPNQRWLVSTDSEGRVLRWDLKSDQIKQTFEELLPGGERIGAALILPGSRWLLIGDDSGKYSMLDLDQPGATPVLYLTDEMAVTSLVTNSDASRILSASEDKQIRSWKWNGSELSETTIGIHSAQAVDVALDTTGTMALSASWDGHAFFWDFTLPGETTTSLSLVGDGDELHAVAFSPDGKWIAAAGRGGKIWLWQTLHCRLTLENQDLLKLLRKNPPARDAAPSAKPAT